MSNIEALLAPIIGRDPAGPDLEYDPDFLAMERAALHVPERRMGADSRPERPASWREVETLATSLLLRTKDWRVARLLLQAWLRRDGIAGMALGLQLLQGLAERFGNSVHPRDDDDDNGGCRSPWALAMEGEGSVLEDLRGIRLGAGAAAVSLREIERAIEGERSYDAARAVARSAAAADSTLLGHLNSCVVASKGLLAAWERSTGDRLPFDEPYRLLARLHFTVAAPAQPVSVRSSTADRLLATGGPIPNFDIDALTEPCNPDSSCGDDLEYDQRMIELELELNPRPAAAYAGLVRPPVEPDWGKVQELSSQLLLDSRDLRTAAAWTRAATRRYGPEGTARGLQLICRLLVNHGLALHPRCDDEDADPLWPRRAALNILDEPGHLFNDLLAWSGLDRQQLGGSGQRATDVLAAQFAQQPDCRDWLALAMSALDEATPSPGVDDLLVKLRGQLHRLLDETADAVPTGSANGASTAVSESTINRCASHDVAAALELLCVGFEEGLAEELCARAKRILNRRFDELERALASRGAGSTSQVG